MIKASLVSLGARIPAQLKREISLYCDRHGIKLQFFVEEAIRQRLLELQQEKMDNAIVDERMKNPELSTMEEFKKYVEQRKKNS